MESTSGRGAPRRKEGCENRVIVGVGSTGRGRSLYSSDPVISQRPNLTTSRAFCLNCAPALRESPYSGTRLSGSRTMLQSQDPFYAGLGQAIRIGTELLAALIVGGGLGWAIDTYLLDTGPWVMVVGLMLGALAGVRNAYRMAQRWPKESIDASRKGPWKKVPCIRLNSTTTLRSISAASIFLSTKPSS